MNTRTIIGCGDIGRRVAHLYQKQGIQTRSLVRTEESANHCEENGFSSVAMDMDESPGVFPWMQSGQLLFWFAPPPTQGISDTRLAGMLPLLPEKIRKFVLISTTGVYGDCDSSWIDETWPARAVADRAKRRLDAEHQVMVWANKRHIPWVILRVPGIYARERLPESRIRKAVPIVNHEESGWTNRIHADDLARVCQIAMDNPAADNEIFNVCDGQPSTMTEYFDRTADLLGLARPPKISMQEAEIMLSAGMVSYLKESRKISNRKLIEKLGVTLRYPSFESFCEQQKNPAKF